MYYFIIPAKITYKIDDFGNKTDEILSIEPTILPGGCICDCKDGINFLVKNENEIPGLVPINEQEFNEVVNGLGFISEDVKNWTVGGRR